MIGGAILVMSNDGRKVAVDLGRFVSIEDHGQGGASLTLDGAKKPQRIDHSVDEFLSMVEATIPTKPPDGQQPPQG